MTARLVLDGRSLTLRDLVRVSRTPGVRVEADPAALQVLGRSHQTVAEAIARVRARRGE